MIYLLSCYFFVAAAIADGLPVQVLLPSRPHPPRINPPNVVWLRSAITKEQKASEACSSYYKGRPSHVHIDQDSPKDGLRNQPAAADYSFIGRYIQSSSSKA